MYAVVCVYLLYYGVPTQLHLCINSIHLTLRIDPYSPKKVDVNGASASPLYTFLKAKAVSQGLGGNKKGTFDLEWNFHKVSNDVSYKIVVVVAVDSTRSSAAYHLVYYL